MPAIMFIGNLNYVAIAVIGGLRVASGSMSLGDVQAFIQYSRKFTQPLTTWRRCPTCCSRASPRPSGSSSCSTPTSSCPTRPTRGVAAHRRAGRVRATSRSATPRTRRSSSDLSLVAEPGQTVAIVGPTGAGKTTLVNLIMRFYELDGGRITLDGVDIATMTRDDLRSQIGMVLQDTWLFGGTIRDNIAYGKPGRDRGRDPRGRARDLRRPLRARRSPTATTP